MILKVVEVFPVTNSHPVALVERQDAGEVMTIQLGEVFRCGGLRYTVASVHQPQEKVGRQLGLELVGEQGVAKGMLLRPVSEPMGVDELCSVMGRLVFIVSNVLAADAQTANRFFSEQEERTATMLEVDRLLKTEGVYHKFREAFEALLFFKQNLPEVVELRKMDQVQAQLNEQLGVIKIGQSRAIVGGSKVEGT